MPWFYEHYRDESAIGIHTTELLHAERSEFQAIAVHETVGHGRLLTLDEMVMVTELDEFVYHELLSHVPLCVHEHPRRVLVVGGGDGGTVREVLRHPSVERVVLCEIDERVTRVCQRFMPSIAGWLDDPRVELVFADATAYVKRNPSSFDAILVDSTEPIGPAAALFGEQFFRDLERALLPGGVISSQAESPFYAPELVGELFASVRRVFASVHGYYGMIPTYPGGGWVFCLASHERRPEHVDLDRAATLATRYYSPDLARGAFALPPFIRQLVSP
ncbi:MAG TPA: polyamine aminopropyltransferase [Enhygromyxa sp.]|nr:polyamine aminopropyltransferase [Enhygromyxa sp.]